MWPCYPLSAVLHVNSSALTRRNPTVWVCNIHFIAPTYITHDVFLSVNFVISVLVYTILMVFIHSPWTQLFIFKILYRCVEIPAKLLPNTLATVLSGKKIL